MAKEKNCLPRRDTERTPSSLGQSERPRSADIHRQRLHSESHIARICQKDPGKNVHEAREVHSLELRRV